MPQAASPLSIADLERMLDERRAQLQELLKKRDQAQKEVDDLDADIQAAASLDGPVARGRRRRRVKNEKSLRAVVLEILAKNKKGFTLAELADKVAESGYKSGSRNFRNVLYQCLYNTEAIVHDETSGCYRLKK